MRKIACSLLLAAGLAVLPAASFAAADVAGLYAEAAMEGNASALDRLLAPNFIFIGPDGHIRDREFYLRDVQSKDLALSGMTLKNMRESSAGTTRVITGNATLQVPAGSGLPTGLMRISVVTDKTKNKKERVVLVQLTPVIPTKKCPDGNCRLR